MNQELQTQLQEETQKTPGMDVAAVPEVIEVPEVTETMEDYAKELEASFRRIEEGDILSGTVIHISEEGVILDLRYYTQGVIKAEDMSDAPDFAILQDVQLGDVIEASVVKMDDGRGNILHLRFEPQFEKVPRSHLLQCREDQGTEPGKLHR